MRRIKCIAQICILLLIGAGLFLSFQFMQEKKLPKVHKLTTPLLFGGANSSEVQYLLPEGTSMYFDQSFPEGFARYIVYFNVEGVKLDAVETNEKFWLDPLTAYPIDKDSLQILLEKHPLSKDDLRKILKSGSLSKSEIQNLLAEYSK